MKRAILLFLLWSVSGLAATTEVRQDRTTRVLVGRSTIVSSNFLGQTTQPLSQFAATTSAELAGVLSDETGSGGGFVRATSPTLTTPDLGTPSSVNLANATGLPITTGVSGLGTGVATWLGTPSSSNLAGAITDETGTGFSVFSDAPTFTGNVSMSGLVVTDNGALSDPAVSVTGTPITGGTATTTTPLVKVGSGADGNYSVNGTMLNVNAPTGFSGHLFSAKVNGGADMFSVSSSGIVIANTRYAAGSGGSAASPTFAVGSSGLYIASNDNLFSVNGTLAARISTDSIALGSSSDAVLVRDGAANTLALRNGVNAQKLNVYNTYTDGSNGEWCTVDWKAVVNECIIGTFNNGTGSTRALSLASANSRRWQITTSGNFIAMTDNVYDIGASSASRPKIIHTGSGAVLGSVSIDSLAGTTTLRMRSDVDGILLLQNDATTSFDRIQFGGTSTAFPAIKRSSTELQVRLADDSADAPLKAAQLTTTGGRVVNRTADISTSITLTSAHHFVTLNNASPVTCNLPAVASNSGREYWIKNLGASDVTIDPNSTEQIRDTTSDASTLTLTSGGTCHIICDGTRWERF